MFITNVSNRYWYSSCWLYRQPIHSFLEASFVDSNSAGGGSSALTA